MHERLKPLEELCAVARDNWKTAIALGAAVIAVIAAVSATLSQLTVIADWIAKGITVKDANTVEVGLWLRLGVGMVLGSAFVFGVATLALTAYSVRLRQGTERSRALERAYDQVVNNANLIVNQTYPPRKNPPWLFQKVSVKVWIEADGKATVNREETVTAERDRLHYWVIAITGEDDSTPVDFVEQLNFKVTDHTPGAAPQDVRVAYLVKSNKPRKKEVAIYPLPSVSSGVTRVIKTDYSWPGFSTKLNLKGEEEWSFALQPQTSDVAEAEFCVYYASEFGSLSCDPTTGGGGTLEEQTDGPMKGFRYRLTNARASSHVLKIKKTARS